MASPARTIDDDQTLLDEILTQVIRLGRGDAPRALLDQTLALAQARRGGEAGAEEELAELVAGLDLDAAEGLARSLTSALALENLAEDNERIRRLRAHETRDAPAPRTGSLRDAVRRLAARGVTAQELQERLAGAEVRLVITAHPTEARRRTTLEKLARIFGLLRDLDERGSVPGVAGDVRRRLLATVQELWASDELRAVSPTVLDEVRTGLVYFISTLAHTVPLVYRDLEEAIAEAYPEDDITVPPLLTFGSWIGGDRDGNPNVTPAMTVQALALMREQCLRFLESRVELLAGRVSLSERVTGPIPGLDPLLDDLGARFPALAAQVQELNAEEPYRRAFTLMRERVRATQRGDDQAYAHAGELLADLRTAERCLLDGGQGALTAAGNLRDVIRQVEVFGFHFARLDVRENARHHGTALHEILADLGVCEDYAGLDDDARIALLRREIADHRPLIPNDISGFGASTRETVETFRMLKDVLGGEHRGAVEAYVIAGSEGPADVLEVLLLMKEAGLTRAGGEDAQLRIVPLYEAGATLASAAQSLDALLDLPEYRAAVRAVGDEQEVMVGYSDSNKDVGYVASGWGTYQAQVQMAQVLRRHGVSWQFFHGRGGAVGRGGGPTNVAIAALPPGTVAGRLKLTEQGEVLATKYAVDEIAHRELELTTSAVLMSTVDASGAPSGEVLARYESVMDEMAARSRDAYRAVVHDDPDFAELFANVTPVDEISRLRLGSRPAKRRATGGIDDLRAIPWVFSWTQARIVLPAWLGLGTGLAAAREEHGVELLREMVRDWPFFAALISNAEMACTKADPAIAARYVALWDDAEPRERLWGALEAELTLTREEIIRVRGAERLLDGDPVLQRVIDRRNPFIDPLSFLQVDLLRRLRGGDDAEPDERLGRVSLICVNGIASGLRNTG